MRNAFPTHDGPHARQRRTRIRALLADEPLGLDRLRSILSAITDVQIVGAVSSGVEARAAMALVRPDLVIVNVEMRDCSGFEVVAGARCADIIFVAPSTDFAADAFRANAVDYLVKPVGADALREALARAQHNLLARQALSSSHSAADKPPPQHAGFWVKALGRAVLVSIDSITRIEAHGEYVLLHADGRAHMIRLGMNHLESHLEGHRLMRVHRSHFARPDDVVEVKRDGNRIVEVLLRCGQWVPVGAKYTKLLRERLAE